MAPIVSALRIQAVAVPTAILSAHTQFPTYYFDDYTDRMKDYIQTYKDLKLDFDAISTGFLGSEQQVDIVLDFIRHFKTDRNFVIVDPVMGDYGKLYRTYTKEMCDKMKELVHYADIITPNLTELCTLLDAPYPENGASIEELKEMCGKLAERGPKHIVVTGIHFNQTQIANFIYKQRRGFPDRHGRPHRRRPERYGRCHCGNYRRHVSERPQPVRVGEKGGGLRIEMHPLLRRKRSAELLGTLL